MFSVFVDANRDAWITLQVRPGFLDRLSVASVAFACGSFDAAGAKILEFYELASKVRG